MRVYIAGPMTGLPNGNVEAFNQAEDKLRGLGFDVLNPADVVLDDGASWLDYMRHTTRMLTQADAVCYLPGWQDSEGAKVELWWAYGVGLPSFDYSNTERWAALQEATA